MGRSINRLLNLEKTVQSVLMASPEARNSNNILYCKVVEKYANVQWFELQGKRFETIMMNISSLRLPQYESVTRVRRKVVSKHPDLAGDDLYEFYRGERQEDFEQFSHT